MELKSGYKQTAIGPVPQDWRLAELADVCKFENGDRSNNYPSPNSFVSNGVPFINAGHLDRGRISMQEMDYIATSSYDRLGAGKVRANDLLFCLRGSLGKYGVVSGDFGYGAIASSLVIVRPKAPAITSQFLSCYFDSAACAQMIETWAGGAAQPNLGAQDLAKFLIAIPEGAEQRAITAVLSDVDALIGALDKLIAKKRDLKQAAMQQLLTGQTRLPGFSGEWAMKRLGDVAEVKTGPFGSSLHESDYAQEGTPIITVEHLGEFGVEHANLPLVSDADRTRLSAYSLEIGDIVFSRVGSVDRNALIRSAEAGWLFSGRLLRVRPDMKRTHPPFLSYQFHSEPFKASVRSVAVGQTMASLNTRILQGLTVTLPSVGDQTAIAAILSDMDAELAALEARRDKTRALKRGMMQELLTGRIRFVPDPSRA